MARRKCPRCAESVRIEAQVCRYCGHELGPLTPDEEFSRDAAAQMKRRFGILAIAAAIGLPLFGILVYVGWQADAPRAYADQICSIRRFRGEACDPAHMAQKIRDYADKWNVSDTEAGKTLKALEPPLFPDN